MITPDALYREALVAALDELDTLQAAVTRATRLRRAALCLAVLLEDEDAISQLSPPPQPQPQPRRPQPQRSNRPNQRQEPDPYE